MITIHLDVWALGGILGTLMALISALLAAHVANRGGRGGYVMAAIILVLAAWKWVEVCVWLATSFFSWVLHL